MSDDVFMAATPTGPKTVPVLKRAGDWVAHKEVPRGEREWTVDDGFAVSHAPTGYRLVGCEFESTALTLVEEADATFPRDIHHDRPSPELVDATRKMYVRAADLEAAAWYGVMKAAGPDNGVDAATVERAAAAREVEELEEALSEARWRLARANQAHSEALSKLRAAAGK